MEKKTLTKIYKSNNLTLERIDNQLILSDNNDNSFNEIFDILIYAIRNDIKDKEFWNTKLNNEDKNLSKPINIIYHLTGSDKIWKIDNYIWKNEWQDMIDIFLNEFEEKILKILNKSKTLKGLKHNLKGLNSEDFYEFGLKNNLIKDGE